MQRTRAVLLLLLSGVLLILGLSLLQGLGLGHNAAAATVKNVPAGDVEIAWFHAATSGSSWERFVRGVDHIRRHWPEDLPRLHVEDRNAFPERTADVPELALSIEGGSGKLWIRWYKLTSAVGTSHWVQALARRSPPPQAIIGGGTSDRARDLALALAGQTSWQGPAPLLLITTATANKVYAGSDQLPILMPDQIDLNRPPWRDLMQVYPDRSFRFCFTNERMAQAVVDFIWSQPELKPHGAWTGMLAALPHAASGNVATVLPLLAAAYPMQQPALYVPDWLDDPYSIDLSEQFSKVVKDPDKKPRAVVDDPIVWLEPVLYSVGGQQYGPNRQEKVAIDNLLQNLARSTEQRSVLALPTVAQPARRFLKSFLAMAPMEGRNLVVATGDSISFNTVHRDRLTHWNIRDVPVPLVFFCHQDPVAWPELDDEPAALTHASATDDVLLNANLVRVVLDAAFGLTAPEPAGLHLPTSADELAHRLRLRQPRFFDDDGNRREGSGECVGFLRPHFDGARVLPSATLEVWSRRMKEPAASRWEMKRRLTLGYGG